MVSGNRHISFLCDFAVVLQICIKIVWILRKIYVILQ